jgi:hypothetical protein
MRKRGNAVICGSERRRSRGMPRTTINTVGLPVAPRMLATNWSLAAPPVYTDTVQLITMIGKVGTSNGFFFLAGKALC